MHEAMYKAPQFQFNLMTVIKHVGFIQWSVPNLPIMIICNNKWSFLIHWIRVMIVR